MYLLYLDESGRHNAEHFVLCGVAVFERETDRAARALDDLQARFAEHYCDFHTTAIRRREKPWTHLTSPQSFELLQALYTTIRELSITLFACVVDRTSFRMHVERQKLDSAVAQRDDDSPPAMPDMPFEDAMYVYAYESLAKRFDRYLERESYACDYDHRGLVLLAQSEMRERLETISRHLHRHGTRWGELRRLGDFMPWFSPAKNSRLLQIADLCANAIFGYYESGLAGHFNRIYPKFYQADGRIHGLFHFTRNFRECSCPGCVSRIREGRFAGWGDEVRAGAAVDSNVPTLAPASGASPAP